MTIALLGMACAIATACGGTPSLVIQAPATGTHVTGNVVALTMAASGVTLATPNGSSTDTAHFSVYVDAPPVAPGTPVIPGDNVVSSAATTVTVSGLTVGRHTLLAVLADGAGKRLSSASASLSVTVDGPAVTARVVGQVKANTQFSLSITSYGVTVADIPADTSGKTAHYIIVIDGPMPKPGSIFAQAPQRDLIETTGSLVAIPPLAKGTHTLWVVLVNGAVRTLSPLSAAKVTVTVP